MTKILGCFSLFFLALMPVWGQDAAASVIHGGVVDKTGSAVVGAQVTLLLDGTSRETTTDGQGEFSLQGVKAGEFQIRVTAKGFAVQQVPVVVHTGETVNVPQIVLELGRVTTDVTVSSRQTEIAEAQIKEQEKQRIIGILPNYYVSYEHSAVPLVAKQKAELGAKLTFDPVGFLITGVTAGVQQARNDYKGYGQGAEGYAKRYGANYADFFDAIMLSNVVFPSIFKQDPRYFVKGEGSTRSRLGYAMAASFRCKGDNGRWQVRYSEWLGQLGSAGISNLYYPAKDRNGVGLTFQNFGIGIGGSMAGHIFQEFASKKLTPKHKL